MTTLSATREQTMSKQRRKLERRCHNRRRALVRHVAKQHTVMPLVHLIEQYGDQPRGTSDGQHTNDIDALIDAGLADALLPYDDNNIRSLVGDNMNPRLVAELCQSIAAVRSADQALADHDRQAEREREHEQAQQQDEVERAERERQQKREKIDHALQLAEDTKDELQAAETIEDAIAIVAELAEQLSDPASRGVFDPRHNDVHKTLRSVLIEIYRIGSEREAIGRSLTDADKGAVV